MNDEQILQEFEALADRLEIAVSYESLEGAVGGLCVAHGQRRFILERDLDTDARIAVFAREFARLELDEFYLLPRVRELIERFRRPS